MKKLLPLVVLVLLCGCQPAEVNVSNIYSDSPEVTTVRTEKSEEQKQTITSYETSDKVDIDLTSFSTTTHLAIIYNIGETPEEYANKRIKMKGDITALVAKDNGYSIGIWDATKCCYAGFEFTYEGDELKDVKEATIIGTLVVEEHEEYTFAYLADIQVL